MLPKEQGQSFEESKNELQNEKEKPIENANQENFVRNRSNKPEAKKSALHSLRAPSATVASHSEMLHPVQDVGLVMPKYTVYWLNPKDNDKLYKIVVEWPHVEKVKEAIRDIIPYINQLLAEDNSNYILSMDPKNYEFYKAKKSGKAKDDFPVLGENETLSTTVEKSLNAILSRDDTNKFSYFDTKTEGKKNKEEKMIESKMPTIKSVASRRTMEENEDYVIQTVCCCFKVKKRTSSRYQEKNQLEQDLLHS